jgi:hypothetical protein
MDKKRNRQSKRMLIRTAMRLRDTIKDDWKQGDYILMLHHCTLLHSLNKQLRKGY